MQCFCQKLVNILFNLLNIPLYDVPVGEDENFKVKVRKFEEEQQYCCVLKSHYEFLLH